MPLNWVLDAVRTVQGTKGYERVIEEFVRSSQSLAFEETNADFIPFLPINPSRVLDAGCGAGQNAAALARLGHSVTAVDPMPDFLEAAKNNYRDSNISWANDSLPSLASMETDWTFEFVLIDGVWHHLSATERMASLERVSHLLLEGGRCAISLRNGPAGAGTHLFPTNVEETIATASKFGLSCIFRIENQSSLMPGKDAVKWARLVFERGV